MRPLLRSLARRARNGARLARRVARRDATLYELLPSSRLAIHLAYNTVLERKPDPDGMANYRAHLRSGRTRAFMLDELRWSMESHDRVRPRELLVSLHLSRCDFIQSLPPARRILDLGGSHQSNRDGAFVSMGYPYDFERLVLVDLPHDERHEIYQHSELVDVVQTRRGPVEYQYHSMTDLSRYDDESFDLVYSGQTIEHVTEDECDVVLKEVQRVLRPGGWFAVDTPNDTVCRLQMSAFTNPDHKIEYRDEQFREKLLAAGFTSIEARGLNYLGGAVGTTPFDVTTVAANRGVYGSPRDCYLLAYVATKPGSVKAPFSPGAD